VRLQVISASALLFSCAFGAAAKAQAPAAAADASTPAGGCDVEVRPAAAIHSVGEDFDAIHDVDHDLANYYRAAGKPLNWLSTERQVEILEGLKFGEAAGFTERSRTVHREAISRRQALDAGPVADKGGCVVDIMLPQIMLERGGLASRSLRLFGVIRRYQNGQLVKSYSGYAGAPLTGFRLKSPADAESATALVEQSYRSAVQTFLRNAAASKSK
jgi:hypothetical protein